jgi:hypothetical protein
VAKIYDGEKTASSTNVGKNGYLPAETETRHMPITLYWHQLKVIKDLKIRPKTLQLVQRRAGNTLEAISIGKDFLSRTLAAKQLKKDGHWDYMKLKSFCTTKEMVSKLKRPPTEWKKIFASDTSDKGLITRIYRELKKTKLLKNQ